MGWMAEFDCNEVAMFRRQQEQIEALERIVECLRDQLILVTSAVKDLGHTTAEEVTTDEEWFSLATTDEMKAQFNAAKTNGESV